ncbi:hypothetical protein DFH09DRAFT_1290994 [Mycena vulgaris]|nr:hypothetical protein DFH09DRAFT_1290994 [Mycena vulgaris]
MPPTRSARRRDSASPFNAPGRTSMFSRARGVTINGGTFIISGSQPLDHPSLPNRLSRYVEHLEARLALLEDLINLSMENNPNDQPAYGDETGAPELVRESRKDVEDHSGSMPANSSQDPSNSRGSCIAECHGGFHLCLSAPSVSTITASAGAVETAVRDAGPIRRSSCAERLQVKDTAVVLDGCDISIGTIQL